MWNVNKKTFGILVIVLIVSLDQLLKYLAIQKSLPAWKVFSYYFCNPNLALSFSLNPLFFWLSWILAIISLLFLIKKFKSFFLLLVLAGALANLTDRLWLGCVVDCISVFGFPIFNLADFFISFGFLGFLINSTFK